MLKPIYTSVSEFLWKISVLLNFIQKIARY